MVVMTAKVSKAKIIALFCILAAAVCIGAYALFGSESGSGTEVAAGNAASNEARVDFLASYGWQVDTVPTETQEVRIPAEMNEVFTAYNELQRTQGYDLAKFAGKTVTRHVYQVTNYANADAPVYASLLVCDGAVIGGDITSTAGAGTMHGFDAPAGSQLPAAAAEEAVSEDAASEDALQEEAEAAPSEDVPEEDASKPAA